MKSILRISAAVAAMAVCTLASAQSAGSWSVRAGMTRIDPQTKSGLAVTACL